MLIKMVITKLLNSNKKVPAGSYVLNIHLIIITRKHPTMYLKSTFTLN